MRLRRTVRLEALVLIAILGAALVTVPWETLSLIVIVYLALTPFSMARYARIRRQRASQLSSPAGPEPGAPPAALPEDRPARRRRSGPNSPSK